MRAVLVSVFLFIISLGAELSVFVWFRPSVDEGLRSYQGFSSK
jgi:hypothetical protein